MSTTHPPREQGILNEEREYFEKNQADFIKNHPGKALLIRGSEIIEIFDTLHEAVIAGQKLEEPGPYLARWSEEVEIPLTYFAFGAEI